MIAQVRNTLAPAGWAVRRVTAPIRALPDFLVIGAMKAGTTSLYHYLRQHPDIGRARTKEVHYFDDNYDQGLSWYRAHFPRKGAYSMVGEATPSYLFDPDIPGRIARTLPGVRLIAVLRDPVERTISHYWHEVRKGREQRSLEEAIRADYQRMQRGKGMYGTLERHFTYLERGHYVEQLERYEKHYEQDQIFIASSSRLLKAPGEVTNEIVEWLGLKPFNPKVRLHNSNSYDDTDPELRAWLTDYYHPWNERLFEHLGCDFGWLSHEG